VVRGKEKMRKRREGGEAVDSRERRNNSSKKRSEETMLNQTTSCYTCRNQTEDIPRPLWGIQAENHL